MALTIYRSDWTQRPIQGVLFDMDGLVIDTEKLYARFWMEACQFYGFPMTWEQALRMRAANGKLSEANLHEFFGPDVNYRQCRAKRIELMEAHIDRFGLEEKPGIRDLLDVLQQKGIATAITSSSPRDRIKKHLSSLGLYHCFDKICSGYEVPLGKPEPDIYLHGAASIGIPPQHCLALEDAPTGILSAYTAGCMTVMVPDQDEPNDAMLRMLYAKADSLYDVICLIK